MLLKFKLKKKGSGVSTLLILKLHTTKVHPLFLLLLKTLKLLSKNYTIMN